MNNVLNKIHRYRENRRRRRELEDIYSKFREFTMITRDLYIANLMVAVKHRHVEGCVIECGTWRGGMIAGIAEMFGPSRAYYLFDSFQGLPPAREIDGEAALSWQADTENPQYYDNCSAPVEFAERAMTMSGAQHYQLIKGWFSDTLPSFRPREKIAILRLDADWFDSTLVCLESLIPHMAPGGIVLIDDYYTWDGCSRAVHQFLASRDSAARLSEVLGVCVLSSRDPGGWQRIH